MMIRFLGRCALGMMLYAGAIFACGQDDEELWARERAEKTVSWQAKTKKPSRNVKVKLLAINDFHGQISAGKKVAGRPVGSAPVLASYLASAQDGFNGTAFIVHAGDFVGASPASSGLLQDEPAIMFLNQVTNDRYGCAAKWCNVIGTPGNHEFDEGVTELFRLINGGTHEKGPFLQNPWKGANFPYICANVTAGKRNRPILPPFVVRKAGREKIGFIGAVLRETPTMVTPSGMEGLTFGDEADAINASVAALKRMHVRAIVVLLHQGGTQPSYAGPTHPDSNRVSGAIVDIVNRMDEEVDAVISGHSHGFTNALLPRAGKAPVLVTQAWSAGTAFGDIDLEIDKCTGDVVAKSAEIITTWADEGPGLTPDPKAAELVAAAEEKIGPFVNRVVGTASANLTRTQNPAGESALGNLIADAQRAAMGTDFAMMNPGGIRADVAAGEVTWGELYAVQPFNNYLIKMELTGQRIYDLLNQQWAGQPYPRVLQVSGFSYVWEADESVQPIDDRIVEVRTNGVPIDRAAVYTVTVNSFLADGGDNFSVLRSGANKVVGPVDLDALVSSIDRQAQPFGASIEGRIERLH